MTPTPSPDRRGAAAPAARRGPTRVTGRVGLFALVGVALQGCSSLTPAQEVSAVRLCSAAQCAATAGRVGTPQLLQGLHGLLARNDGAPLQLCEAERKTGECQRDDVGCFVLGGVLPGRGSASSATLSPVRMDTARQELRLRVSTPLRFLDGPGRCGEHDATLQVASPGRIGGWWRHHVGGTGNGRGQGCASIRVPLGLSPGEARAALQTAAATPRG